MNTWSTAGEQLPALGGGVVDADGAHRVVVRGGMQRGGSGGAAQWMWVG